MPCPFFLTRLLARSGIGHWLPGLCRRFGYDGRVLRHCSDLALATPSDLFASAAECLRPTAHDVIDLSLGAPRFDLLPSASSRLPMEQRGWPPFAGLPELRAAIVAKLQRDNDLTFFPDEICVTAGALGAVNTALDAFVNPGDRVVLFDPTSPLYPLVIRARRGRIRWLPSWLANGNTRFRLDDLKKLLRGARLLVLNSPANPTGGILAADDLEQIAWWADKHDVLILSDEVFERYQYEGASLSIGSLPRARQRTLTVGSMSKSHALAAARVGWLAAPRPLLTPCLAVAAARAPFAPTQSQQLALAALEGTDDALHRLHGGFESRRRYTYDRLRALDLNVDLPAGAFFFWVATWQRGESGREFARRLLAEQQVRVTPGDLFGPSGAGYARLSYAVEEGRLQEGLNRIAAMLGTCANPQPVAAARAA